MVLTYPHRLFIITKIGEEKYNYRVDKQVIKIITTYEGQIDMWNLCMWYPEKYLASSNQDYNPELENVFKTFKIEPKKTIKIHKIHWSRPR